VSGVAGCAWEADEQPDGDTKSYTAYATPSTLKKQIC